MKVALGDCPSNPNACDWQAVARARLAGSTMAEKFDPYYKWLGISPQNQPPDLYRLLALERFETDLEVIEAAANRQMAYIQSCSTGPYVEHSQKLLNEIAAARLCLLDVRRKSEYDSILRDKLLAGGQTVRAVSVPPSNDEALTATLSDLDATIVTVPGSESRRVAVPPPAPARPKPGRPSQPAASTAVRNEATSRTTRRIPRKRAMPLAAVLALGLLVVIAMAAAGYMLFATREDNRTLADRVAQHSATDPQNGKQPAVPKQNPLDFPPIPAIQGTNAATADSALPDESEAKYRAAEEALQRRDLNAAVQILIPIADNPQALKQAQAHLLLSQIATVTSDDWGRNQLMSLDNESFDQFVQGKSQFEFRNDQQPLHPTLVSVARETLRRVLPDVQHRRIPGGPPPGGQPAPAPSPAKPAEAPVDPADVLRARGMKRIFDTWVVADESRCEELAEQAMKAEQRQRELAKQQRAMTQELGKAKTKLDQDAVDAAQAELERLRKETADAAKQQADAQEQARTLAAGVDDQYRRLAADPQIKDVLGQLQQKLGPSEEFKKLQAEINPGRPRGK